MNVLMEPPFMCTIVPQSMLVMHSLGHCMLYFWGPHEPGFFTTALCKPSGPEMSLTSGKLMAAGGECTSGPEAGGCDTILCRRLPDASTLIFVRRDSIQVCLPLPRGWVAANFWPRCPPRQSTYGSRRVVFHLRRRPLDVTQISATGRRMHFFLSAGGCQNFCRR